MGTGVFPGVKPPGREFGLLPVFSADVKNECSCFVPKKVKIKCTEAL
jgi:hypothetical protein